MVGKPPGAWFIGIMLLPAICWLAVSRSAEDGGYPQYFLGLGTILAVLAVLIRVTLTLWPRMLGAPPGPWFIGAVAAVGVCVLALDWFIAVETGVEAVVLLAAFVTVIAVIGRTALAFWLPRRAAKAWAVRTGAPGFLLAAVMFVLGVFPPGEVRWELSRHELAEYARTVEEGESCGEPRWVGYYRVTCASRDGGVVSLAIDEPLLPTYGRPWLVGPSFRETWIQD